MATRRSANTRHSDISPLAWAFLNDALLPDTYDPWELFVLQFDYLDPETGHRASDLRKMLEDSTND